MTGLAMYDMLAEGFEYVGEVPYDEFGFHLEPMLNRFRPDVACENFIITAKTVSNSQAPWSLEQIGIAKYLANKYQCPYVKQLPAQAKTFATNSKLRALGWYV